VNGGEWELTLKGGGFPVAVVEADKTGGTLSPSETSSAHRAFPGLHEPKSLQPFQQSSHITGSVEAHNKVGHA
jgi:hypothetical protein